MVEVERQLLFRRLVAFPVNHEDQSWYQRSREEARKREEEHLHKTGFYDDNPVQE